MLKHYLKIYKQKGNVFLYEIKNRMKNFVSTFPVKKFEINRSIDDQVGAWTHMPVPCMLFTLKKGLITV